jgi:hypothetical protein
VLPLAPLAFRTQSSVTTTCGRRLLHDENQTRSSRSAARRRTRVPAAARAGRRCVCTQPALDVTIMGAGMTGLACAPALLQRGMPVVAYDETGRPRRTVGDDRTIETLRCPKQIAGAGPRDPVADVSRLVRGAVRPRRIGRARQDSAAAVYGLPAPVPPGPRAAGPERSSCTDFDQPLERSTFWLIERTCSRPAFHQCPVMAGTVRSRSTPTAATGSG